MCTAITYKTDDSYFGRNLDVDCVYGEALVFTPRNYELKFKMVDDLKSHYAILGMGKICDGYSLYFDGINEKGLGMAGLSFPDGTEYKEIKTGKDNVSSFEFIPWVLGRCSDIREAKELLKNINITKENFSDDLPASPLHWIIADKSDAITVEAGSGGVMIYNNPIGVLTNDPGFDMQMFNLNNYLNITGNVAENRFSDKIELKVYCKGMGGIGLPGDLSSMSRFVRASFVKLNSVSGKGEKESVSQFFHILESVYQQRGCVKTGDGKYEITDYSSCCNLKKGIYYYKSYENNQISAIDMNKEDFEGGELISYNVIKEQQVYHQN